MCTLSPVNFVSEPFVNKHFKGARVTLGLISNTCLSLFFKIISTCSWLCCAPGSAQYYDSLSIYYLEMGTDRFGTYCKYGDKVLNFAMNRTTYIDGKFDKKVKGVKELKKIYGKKKLKPFLKIGTADLPIERKLLRKNKFDRGCCFGMSLDFNARYLKKRERGIKQSKAIAQASRHYSGGATDRADLLQIFYKSLQINSPSDDKTTQLILDRWKTMSNQAGLSLDKKNSCLFLEKKVSKKSDALKDFIKGLSDGVYTVLFTPPKGEGHAVSLIKEGKHYYLFNPDYGTFFLSLREFTKEIHEMSQAYAEDKECQIVCLHFTLKP